MTAGVAPAARAGGFDGLRAIAAGSILVLHVTSRTGATGDDPLGRYFARLDVGVAVFFVISAFLLYRPFAAAHLGTPAPPSVRAFWWRRAVRIYPAYWLALTTVIVVFGNTELSGWWDHLRHYLLVQGYQPAWGLAGIVPAWTLSVEVAFYALLPLYAWAMGRLTARRPVAARLRIELLGAALVFVSAYVVRAVIVEARGTDSPWLHVLPPLADWFALGLALAVVRAASEQGALRLGRAEQWIAGAGWLSWVAGASAFVVVANIGLPVDGTAGTPAEDLARQVLYGAVGFFLVAPLALASRPVAGLHAVLDHRVVVALGTVSYGVFLWHHDWIEQLVEWGLLDGRSNPALLLLVAALALSLATAAASWLLVERPLLRRGRRAVRPGGTRAGAAV